ncbi:MAG TPA: hypothetical protein VF297_05360 [Pyrinomonadaceae bacterium]
MPAAAVSTQTQYRVTAPSGSRVVSWDEAQVLLRQAVDKLDIPERCAPERGRGRRGGTFRTTWAGSEHYYLYVRGNLRNGTRERVGDTTFEEVKTF